MSRVVLEKGGRINLDKEAPGLTRVRLGLSWSPNGYDTGTEWDLDVSVFACAMNADGVPKLVNDDYFVFYNSCFRTEDGKTAFEDVSGNPKRGKPASPCLGIVHTGDNKTGQGAGDDESILVDLSRIDPRVDEISVVVTIHDWEKRRQNFGQVKDSAIRIYNHDTGEVLATYSLEDDFSTETAVQFGSLYKKNGAWLFKAIGAGFKKGLGDFLQVYSA